jgi:hypothetical protein
MPSSAIHVLWLCLSPWAVIPCLTGSQQASGTSSGIFWMPRPRGGVNALAPGWAHGQVAAGRPGQATRAIDVATELGCRFRPMLAAAQRRSKVLA